MFKGKGSPTMHHSDIKAAAHATNAKPAGGTRNNKLPSNVSKTRQSPDLKNGTAKK